MINIKIGLLIASFIIACMLHGTLGLSLIEPPAGAEVEGETIIALQYEYDIFGSPTAFWTFASDLAYNRPPTPLNHYGMFKKFYGLFDAEDRPEGADRLIISVTYDHDGNDSTNEKTAALEIPFVVKHQPTPTPEPDDPVSIEILTPLQDENAEDILNVVACLKGGKGKLVKAYYAFGFQVLELRALSQPLSEVLVSQFVCDGGRTYIAEADISDIQPRRHTLIVYALIGQDEERVSASTYFVKVYSEEPEPTPDPDNGTKEFMNWGISFPSEIENNTEIVWTVLDAETDEPVENARVAIYTPDGIEQLPLSEGTYSYLFIGEEDRASTFEIRLNKAGYRPFKGIITVVASGPDIAEGAYIKTDPELLVNVSTHVVNLLTDRCIYPRTMGVSEEKTKSLSEAHVSVIDLTNGQPIISASTDSDGYTVLCLPTPGYYKLRISHDDYNPLVYTLQVQKPPEVIEEEKAAEEGNLTVIHKVFTDRNANIYYSIMSKVKVDWILMTQAGAFIQQGSTVEAITKFSEVVYDVLGPGDYRLSYTIIYLSGSLWKTQYGEMPISIANSTGPPEPTPVPTVTPVPTAVPEPVVIVTPEPTVAPATNSQISATKAEGDIENYILATYEVIQPPERISKIVIEPGAGWSVINSEERVDKFIFSIKWVSDGVYVVKAQPNKVAYNQDIYSLKVTVQNVGTPQRMYYSEPVISSIDTTLTPMPTPTITPLATTQPKLILQGVVDGKIEEGKELTIIVENHQPGTLTLKDAAGNVIFSVQDASRVIYPQPPGLWAVTYVPFDVAVMGDGQAFEVTGATTSQSEFDKLIAYIDAKLGGNDTAIEPTPAPSQLCPNGLNQSEDDDCDGVVNAKDAFPDDPNKFQGDSGSGNDNLPWQETNWRFVPWLLGLGGLVLGIRWYQNGGKQRIEGVRLARLEAKGDTVKTVSTPEQKQTIEQPPLAERGGDIDDYIVSE